MSAHLTSNLHGGVDTGARSHQTLHPTTIPEEGGREEGAVSDPRRLSAAWRGQSKTTATRPGRQGNVLALQRAGPLRRRASLAKGPRPAPPPTNRLLGRPSGRSARGESAEWFPRSPQQLARQADKSVTDLPRGRSGPLSFSGRSRVRFGCQKRLTATRWPSSPGWAPYGGPGTVLTEAGVKSEEVWKRYPRQTLESVVQNGVGACMHTLKADLNFLKSHCQHCNSRHSVLLPSAWKGTRSALLTFLDRHAAVLRT